MPEPRGRLADKLIAGRVAEGVVDVLEAVDVEIKQRHARGVMAGEDKRTPQAVLEQSPVGQAGERVVEGEILRFILAGLQRGRGAAEPAQQECQKAGRHKQRHAQRRRHFAHQGEARPLPIPADKAEDDTARTDQRDRRRADRLRKRQKARTVEQVFFGNLVDDGVVDELHRHMQIFGAGCLRDPVRTRH